MKAKAKLPYSITVSESFNELPAILKSHNVSNKKVLIIIDSIVKKHYYYDEKNYYVPV